ncbi:PAS domain-containing sensor histidine kinase [Cnuella takakiae]|nr:PAS domain-containing sensor histidine kinase [Cnuella takakiae]
MDLILAHKRSMKLAELAGLTLSAQTTFATAVSEVSRSTIEHGKNGCLVLGVTGGQKDKYLIARVIDEKDLSHHPNEGLEYAKRLVNKYNISTSGTESSIELFYYIPNGSKLSINQLDDWRSIFRNEQAVSPYEEIKQKNDQLQKLAQKLQESESQYRTLTNALPIIIFSLNDKGELIYANEWLKRFTGFSATQLNESKWREVIHPDDYDAFSVILSHKLSMGASTIRTQCRLRHKGEEDYYWHLASVSPLYDEGGKLLNWIGYIVDINAQKLVEETLKDNRELKAVQQQLREHQVALEENIAELNRSNQELQQFAYVASHDLQEPTRKISFFSDYLLSRYSEVIDQKGRGHLHSMQSAAQRMRSLIHDLLSFSQVEGKRIDFKPVNLEGVLHFVQQSLEVTIQEKGAVLEIGSLPMVRGDEGMLIQMFENLVGNALKYAKDDEAPYIHIEGQQSQGRIELRVQDNGIGFDEKYLTQMFALFQRLHSSNRYKGTGLGLAICKKIVLLHGGTITARSTPGAGATFIISLPTEIEEHAS